MCSEWPGRELGQHCLLAGAALRCPLLPPRHCPAASPLTGRLSCGPLLSLTCSSVSVSVPCGQLGGRLQSSAATSSPAPAPPPEPALRASPVVSGSALSPPLSPPFLPCLLPSDPHPLTPKRSPSTPASETPEPVSKRKAFHGAVQVSVWPMGSGKILPNLQKDGSSEIRTALLRLLKDHLESSAGTGRRLCVVGKKGSVCMDVFCFL